MIILYFPNISNVKSISTRGQAVYTEVGNVVDQTIRAITTVASFTGEKKAIEKYNSKLKVAYTSMIQQGTATGFRMGLFSLIVFSTYGLAMWYGSMLVLEKGYTGGTVMSVIIALMTGGMSLGQKSPCIDAFTIEQVAAYKMFETIKRKPKIDAYDTSGKILEDIKGDIELKDVYFRYPARPDVKIFVGFSLFVPSGITTALCGTKQERLLGTSCNDNHLIPRSFLEVSFSSSSFDESSVEYWRLLTNQSFM
ncbi:hypothetical protein RYX36_032959, partial [Vicia faba]